MSRVREKKAAKITTRNLAATPTAATKASDSTEEALAKGPTLPAEPEPDMLEDHAQSLLDQQPWPRPGLYRNGRTKRLYRVIGAAHRGDASDELSILAYDLAVGEFVVLSRELWHRPYPDLDGKGVIPRFTAVEFPYRAKDATALQRWGTRTTSLPVFEFLQLLEEIAHANTRVQELLERNSAYHDTVVQLRNELGAYRVNNELGAYRSTDALDRSLPQHRCLGAERRRQKTVKCN